MLTLPDIAFKNRLVFTSQQVSGWPQAQSELVSLPGVRAVSRRDKSSLQPLASSLIVSLVRGQQGPATGSTLGVKSPVIDFRYLPPPTPSFPLLSLSFSHPGPSNASITVHAYHIHRIDITSCIRHCQAVSRSRRRWRTRVWG